MIAGARVVWDQFINDKNAVGFNAYDLLNLGASYTRGRVQFVLNLTNVTDSVLGVVAGQSPALSRTAIQRDGDRARPDELRP